MRRYRVLEKLGEGSFASVHKCVHESGPGSEEFVAVKRLKTKFESWEKCKRLREVQALTKLKHENIIRCKEVILEKNHELYLVFEFAGANLWQLIRDTSKTKELPVERIQSLCHQIFKGLAHMHKHNFFHRDIKPENILLRRENGQEVIKIADLGCAREIRSRPPYTDYVATRWYRAPELLLRMPRYSSPIDLWATGCIFAELFLRRNLFNGKSDVDMVHQIASKLGTEAMNKWKEGKNATGRFKQLPEYERVPTCQWLTNCAMPKHEHAVDLFESLLSFDPNARVTALNALQHPFFGALRNCQEDRREVGAEVHIINSDEVDSGPCSDNTTDIDHIIQELSLEAEPSESKASEQLRSTRNIAHLKSSEDHDAFERYLDGIIEETSAVTPRT